MDALNSFRIAAAAKSLPIPSSSSETYAEPQPADLAEATHLYFAKPSPHSLPLDIITRFSRPPRDGTDEKVPVPVDLRSVYLAYIWNEFAPQIYFNKVNELNERLPSGQQAQGLQFVEKLELVSWLDGAEASSDLIKPLEISPDVATATTEAVTGSVPVISATGTGVTQTSVNGRPVKVIDARLQAIYNGERKMGDRNTVLRGIKPTVSLSELHLE